MNALLTVDNLRVHFGRGNRVVRAVDDVSLEVSDGETVGLVGESGSGKSTLGRSIVGLVPVTSGSIRFRGADITTLSARHRRPLTADIQMVFQDPFSSLNPSRTIAQTLAEPFLAHGQGDRRRRREMAVDMLGRVELTADALDKYPAQFSGGQRQRIAIARALMLSPRLVICDEPVSALDLSIQAQILNLFADLRDDLGIAYLFIAHDLAVVRHLAQRTVVMYRGQVMESGPAADVNDSPRHPYTQSLHASAPVPDPTMQRRRREARSGLASTTIALTSPGVGCPFASRCPSAFDRCRLERPSMVQITPRHHAACFLVQPAAPGDSDDDNTDLPTVQHAQPRRSP